MALRMVKAGYASSLKEAKEMTAREVLQALHFEAFNDDYQLAYIELNKDQP